MNSTLQVLQTDLKTLEKTYEWALSDAPIEELLVFCKQSRETPLISVGSGGSLTIAAYTALMHQTQGMLAKHMTPWELFSTGACLPQASLLFPSASGKNSDVLNAYRFAAQYRPQNMLAVCGAIGSPLAELTRQDAFSSALEFEIPTGRDGFLATVSLIAFCALLMRGYNEAYGCPWTLPITERLFERAHCLLQQDLNAICRKQTWMMLYGGWGLPVAMDAESKLTESALMSNRMIDYRNFTHGHYHWLVQNPENTGVVALITPAEKALAEMTLNQFPSDNTILPLETELPGPAGTLDLMLQLICLVHALGEVQAWDPASMNVPPYCKTLQSLPYTLPGRNAVGHG